MSVKFCREKLDKERPNLPVIPIEKPKVVKSGIPAGPSVKSGGSKIPPPKTAAKANKVNLHVYFIIMYSFTFTLFD